jgi:phosphoribosyl-AMP cyclohydrolase
MKAPASDAIDWGKSAGLVPAIVQDATSGRILMLGYMSRESYELTLAEGQAVFFSRSKQRLWRKGETSGNTLEVREIRLDCDADTLLVRAAPAGPTCHLGTTSCFGEAVPATLLDELEAVIDGRLAQRPEDSYVAKLAAVRETCAVPLIASGGAGEARHFIDVFHQARVDGALAATVFHSGQIAIPDLKRLLAKNGIEVRQ